MYSRPLGSPTVSQKRPYVHVPHVPYTVFVPGTGMSAVRVSGPWVQAGRVYRVGNTGYPATARCSRRGVPHQRSGPRKPCKGWSGWVGYSSDAPGDHPFGARSVPLQGPSLSPPRGHPTYGRLNLNISE